MKNYNILLVSVVICCSILLAVEANDTCNRSQDEGGCPKSIPPPIECLNTWWTYNDQFVADLITRKETTLNHKADLVNFIATPLINGQTRIRFDQLITLFESFLFDEKKMLATLNKVSLRLHPTTPEEIVSLINLFEDYENKFSAFKAVYSSLRITTERAKRQIVASLPSCNHSEANELLSSLNQFNCVFGTLQGNIIAFLIEANKRMAEPITKESEVTKLDYIKAQLKETINSQIKPGMKFNIIVSYENKPRKWQIDYQEVTKRNLEQAFKFIDSIKVEMHNGMNTYDTGIAAAVAPDLHADTIAAVWNYWPWYPNCQHCSNFHTWWQKAQYQYKLNYYVFE